MTVFRSAIHSVTTVPVAPEQIWAVLTQPDVVAELTPLVSLIEPRGDVWRWSIGGISGLGIEIAPSFTERMSLVPISRIELGHEPPPGSTERAGVDGTVQITRVGDAAAKLRIDLVVHLDLPVPSIGRGAIERMMGAATRRAGQSFVDNLARHLGIAPSSMRVRVTHA